MINENATKACVVADILGQPPLHKSRNSEMSSPTRTPVRIRMAPVRTGPWLRGTLIRMQESVKGPGIASRRSFGFAVAAEWCGVSGYGRMVKGFVGLRGR